MKFSLLCIASLSVLLTTSVPCVLLAQESNEIALADLPDAPSAMMSAPQSQSASTTQGTSSTSQTTTSSTEDEKEKKKREREAAEIQFMKQEKQHMLGVIPSFSVVYGSLAPPMNAKEKFELALKGSFNPFQFVLVGLVAAVGQAQNNFPEYGQGWKGYGKRYGAGFLDSFNGNMIGNAALPVVLHQDPRYYRMGTGSIKRRFFHSVIAAVRCKGDDGKWQVNYSNILGNLAAGGISNLYYPASDRGFGLTVERGLTVTAEGAIGTLLQEFIPDFQKHFLHNKKNDVPAPSTDTDKP